MRYLFLLFFVVLFACNEVEQPLYDYDVEARVSELGIELTEMRMPPGINISLAVRSGNLLFLSGNGPRTLDGSRITGKVGSDLTVEEGYEAARLTAVSHLCVLKTELGDLNRVEKIVKVLGMVNAGPDFTDHPKVINGYTDLMIEVFGERGKHARSAVGMVSLPWNIVCEVEAIVQIRD